MGLKKLLQEDLAIYYISDRIEEPPQGMCHLNWWEHNILIFYFINLLIWQYLWRNAKGSIGSFSSAAFSTKFSFLNNNKNEMLPF